MSAIDANAAVRACSFIEKFINYVSQVSISEAGLLMPELAML